jgi:hypothetical protein
MEHTFLIWGVLALAASAVVIYFTRPTTVKEEFQPEKEDWVGKAAEVPTVKGLYESSVSGMYMAEEPPVADTPVVTPVVDSASTLADVIAKTEKRTAKKPASVSEPKKKTRQPRVKIKSQVTDKPVAKRTRKAK